MTSGVYQILQKSQNRIVYVGSSVRVPARFREHAKALDRGTHTNRHLQGVWTKYGAADFEFVLLEECGACLLIEREEAWMAALRPTCNIALAADAPMRGRRFSPEHRRRLSEAKRGKKRGPQSEEWSAKISAALMGRPGRPVSEETRLRMSASARARGGRHLLGYKHSEDAKLHMADARKGCLLTEEHRRNIAVGLRAAYASGRRSKLGLRHPALGAEHPMSRKG